ncbi:hypothetical protein [uncultured Alistipes sp.]|uniref:hypothetical protein n=1 Tax=uncultured Alistipes sp. TaxID=538949 RepID=UPI003209AEA4
MAIDLVNVTVYPANLQMTCAALRTSGGMEFPGEEAGKSIGPDHLLRNRELKGPVAAPSLSGCR